MHLGFVPRVAKSADRLIERADKVIDRVDRLRVEVVPRERRARLRALDLQADVRNRK